MDRDPVADARDLISERYPQAVWAVVTGSVVTAHRTPGSDLDIVVLLPDDDPLGPYRASFYYRGWPVEVFVHNAASLDHYLTKERAERKPSLTRMVAAGVPVAGDPADRQQECREALAKGPAPVDGKQREYLRYGLTDRLDDLVHATDPGERRVLAATLWTDAAHQALVAADRWNGNGKWLLRELRDLDEDLATRWLAAQHDVGAIEAFARDVLDRLGGPLWDGFTAHGERPRPVAG